MNEHPIQAAVLFHDERGRVMSNITLRQLKVFTTITQHTTLTASAEKLFLSKAAVSLSLSELEKQLGHALFDRVNNRLILNQEGKRLLPLADELLHRSEDINNLFLSNQPLHGQLKLARVIRWAIKSLLTYYEIFDNQRATSNKACGFRIPA